MKSKVLRTRVCNEPSHILLEMIENYKQFEIDGSIGECTLRSFANEYIKDINASNMMSVVLCMRDITFEALLYFFERDIAP